MAKQIGFIITDHKGFRVSGTPVFPTFKSAWREKGHLPNSLWYSVARL